MYLRELADILNDYLYRIKEKIIDTLKEIIFIIKEFIIKHIKWVSVSLIIIINLILFLVSYDNTYFHILFYPDKPQTRLIAEKRKIIKGKNRKEKIENTIQELLLGPMSPKIFNIFPKGSKLLGIRISNDNILHLNFNKIMFMNLDWEKNDNISIYYIFLQSIVNTIYIQFRDIDNIKIYVDNKEYRFIGDYGPIKNGLKPDWNVLNR